MKALSGLSLKKKKFLDSSIWWALMLTFDRSKSGFSVHAGFFRAAVGDTRSMNESAGFQRETDTSRV